MKPSLISFFYNNENKDNLLKPDYPSYTVIPSLIVFNTFISLMCFLSIVNGLSLI